MPSLTPRQVADEALLKSPSVQQAVVTMAVRVAEDALTSPIGQVRWQLLEAYRQLRNMVQAQPEPQDDD